MLSIIRLELRFIYRKSLLNVVQIQILKFSNKYKQFYHSTVKDTNLKTNRTFVNNINKVLVIVRIFIKTKFITSIQYNLNIKLISIKRCFKNYFTRLRSVKYKQRTSSTCKNK